jgi:hypothetical protein
MKELYLLLAVAGWALAHYFLVTFLIENGLDLPLLFERLFANDISTFFAVDLIPTAIVVLLFSNWEAARLRMGNRWVYPAATLVVGPSFALPLPLCFRAGVLAVEA